MAYLQIRPTTNDKIKENYQQKDSLLLKIFEEVKEKGKQGFRVDEEGILNFSKQVYVPIMRR